MISVKKLVSAAVTVTTSFALTGIGLAGQVFAAPISAASATLSDSTVAASGVTYTVAFTASSTAIRAIKFQFRTTPSSGGAKPTNLTLTSAALGSATGTAGSTTDLVGTSSWSLGTSSAASGDLSIAGATQYSPGGNATYSVALTTITNNTDANDCDSISNSESCYIRITTYSDQAMTTPIDSGVVSYTVAANTTVTATVDPSLTFTIGGVTSQASLSTNDSHAGCGSSADVVATATSIPFGNMRPASYVCGQQSLAVATNASGGYNTYMKFTSATANVAMIGTVTATNYINTFSAGGATFTSPGAWATPTSTLANTNTGYIGVRTTNARVQSLYAGYGTTNNYGTPYVGTGLGNAKVMSSTGPDLGSTLTYVTYKIEVNAAQPADTYTGNINYNVVASY